MKRSTKNQKEDERQGRKRRKTKNLGSSVYSKVGVARETSSDANTQNLYTNDI